MVEGYIEAHDNEHNRVGDEKPINSNINIPMSANYFSNDEILFPLDQTFFVQRNIGNRKSTEGRKQELIHIIKTLDTASKHKKIKIEEIFEILNESQKKPNKNRKNLTKTDAFSKRKETESGKNHLNIKINGRSDNFRRNCNDPIIKLSGRVDIRKTPDTIPKKYQKSLEKIRPYMLDTKSRREVDGYGSYCKRPSLSLKDFRARSTLLKSNGGKKSQFEIRYISPEFIRTSDLSIPGTYNKSREVFTEERNSDIMEKYQTKPRKIVSPKCEKKVLNDRNLEAKKTVDSFAKDITLYFDKQQNMKRNYRRVEKCVPLFERLKGDERDLPGIYTRFLRRSKGVSSRISKNELVDHRKRGIHSDNDIHSSSEDTNAIGDIDMEDYIHGELISDRPISKGYLDMINKEPIEYDQNFFHKVKNKEQLDNSVNVKKKKASKSVNDMEKTVFPSEKKETSSNFKVRTKLKGEKREKTIAKSQTKVDAKDAVKERNHQEKQETSETVLNYDPIKENLNMSPTTAITMMVLAADKVLAKKSDVFADAELKASRTNSKIKISKIARKNKH
ncbi:hypothetical protein HHI36_008926 [Cryptolaemus montrouzieri]|uniref:Uncharacterized protein n=1 Tax=Cryptolaemus montrouzieri TaxID=559131 RepID=A0ABD2MUJ5_9CUCU